MKRYGQLIEKIADPDNLRFAFWKAKKGKSQKPDVIAYSENLDANLIQLRQEILSSAPNIGNYHYFKIYDPKERLICAASFHERVLHHALMNICHDAFERFQVYESYATRKGKGTYAALHQAEKHQRRYKWFLKMDIRKYFDSIHHSTLIKLLERRFKDKKVLSIFEQIIASYTTSPNIGLPIGNLTSQYFANYYLAYADRFIKQTLLLPAYVRYMDDMVVWSNDKSELLEARKRIKAFLEQELHLTLKIAYLNRTTHGLDFVGYRLFHSTTTLSKRSQKRFKQKYQAYYQNYTTGKWSEATYQRHILPLLAFTDYSNSNHFRSKIIQNIGQSS